MDIYTIAVAIVREVNKLFEDFDNMTKKRKILFFCGYVCGCLLGITMISVGMDIRKHGLCTITLLLLHYMLKKYNRG